MDCKRLTPYLLGLSAIILGLMIPGGPIENRSFSNLLPIAALTFNIFLTILGLFSLILIYFLAKKRRWAFITAFVFGILYVVVYLLDLFKIFPVSLDPMSGLLFSMEIIGTIVGVFLVIISYLSIPSASKKKQKRKNETILVIVVALLLIIGTIIVSFATNSALEKNPEENIDIVTGIHQTASGSLPEGYTLETYSIEEITNIQCEKDSDCETPMDYLIQSRCPFTSICLENKCTVVCPDVKTIDFQGEITEIKPEMDGSILTVKTNEEIYEVLVSIPNLGEEFAKDIKEIEVGKDIRVVGNELFIGNKKRIIASQIYVGF